MFTGLSINPLMPGGNKKVTHTETNLQLNAQRSAAGLFKYVWPFCYHQLLKGYKHIFYFFYKKDFFIKKSEWETESDQMYKHKYLYI